ncbi:uncharacterized protein [Rutidosis leptorrhynchoides]|uniref:uncharacterized protein n=1 Tax=Rutidosis leptorrhynchoides TaxID=125765 RepID=UPI003A998C8A
MVETKESGSGSKPVPIVVQSEGVFNIGILLSESNYDIWSQLMEMHIAEREKLSYIIGKSKTPSEDEDGYEKWYAENQKRYLRLPTAREIWKALSKAFHDGSNELQVFALNQKVFTSKQNSRTLSEYYGELSEIFQELDHRDKVTMKDPDDVEAYRKAIDRLRVHIFLAGLDDDLEQIRGEILRKESIPTLEECYALIRREVIRRQTLNGDHKYIEAAAMVSRNKGKAPTFGARGEKPTNSCSECGKTGHSKERCFKVVGYPDWWDHSRAPKKKGFKKAPTVASVKTKTKEDVSDNEKIFFGYIW